MKKEEIKTKLFKQLADCKLRLEKWEKVKRLRKKDGSGFANRQKNFDGAKFGLYSPCEDFMHPYLTIIYNGYTESIPMFLYVDEIKKCDDKLKNTDQIVNVGGCTRSTYLFNIDECFIAINKHIEELKKMISDYEKQIEEADKAIEEADKLIEKINDFLKDENFKDGYFKNTLGYAISDYIRDSMR